MKKLLIAAIAMSTVGLSVNANADPIINPSLERKLVQVCEALRSDSKLQLNRVIKNHGFSYRSIAQGLRCNGDDAITFALNNNANETANLMARKTSIDIDSMVAKR